MKLKKMMIPVVGSLMALSIVSANGVQIVQAADSAVKPVMITPDKTASKGDVTKIVNTVYGDTKTTRGFVWYTTTFSGSSDLQVVEKTSDTPNFTAAAKFSGKSYMSTNSPTEVVHKVEATNLKPNTTYQYRVGDESNNLWSKTGTFKTAPVSGAFSFINLSDTQPKTEDEAVLCSETLAKAMKTVPNSEFISISGDIVDTGKNEQQWNWLLNDSQQTLLNTTFVPVTGNHDIDKNAFMDHFDIKVPEGEDTSSGAYYSYDYSNTHFVVVNNNEQSSEYANFSPAQIDWMKKDVEQAKKAGAKWIVLSMHKGPYTTSNHATDKDIIDVRAKVAPIMENLGIDLVLQGHDHIYARTKPIKNGVVQETPIIKEVVNGTSTEYYVKPDGTIYIIPATAGPKVYYKNKNIDQNYLDKFVRSEESHAAVYGPDKEDATRPARSNVQNFLGITIDNNKLTVISYEIDQNKNNKQPFIIDQFGITKDVQVPTPVPTNPGNGTVTPTSTVPMQTTTVVAPTTSSSNALPNTASDTTNILLVGGMMLLAGSSVLAYRRKNR